MVVVLMDVALIHEATSTVVQNVLSILLFDLSEVVEDLRDLLFVSGYSLIEKK